MKEPHYHINIFWSEKDRRWIADVPDLKYCSAHGATALEAVRQVCTAIELWLETARDEGVAIPKPHYRPAIYAVRDAA